MIIVCYDNGLGDIDLEEPIGPVLLRSTTITEPDGEGDTTVTVTYQRVMPQ